MPTYKYVAVNLQKQKFKGKFIAEDEKDLAIQLARQNLFLESCSLYKGGTPSAFFTLGTGKVKLSELTTFCRQFAIMLSSGIQVIDALTLLKNQTYSTYFKAIISVISDDVKAGVVLSEALDKHKKVFPEFFVSMIHVGEASGKLETVFVSLADYYESDAAIKRKTVSALTYPMILLLMTVAIVFLMMIFVIPRFEDVLAQLDLEIKGFTAAVYGISHFFKDYWQIIVLVILGLAGGTFLFLKTKKGRLLFDAFKIKAPVIGTITTNLITARFARSLSILLNSGMDLASALDATAKIMGNSYIAPKFRAAVEDVRHGITLTGSFQKYGIFPDMLIQMMSVGERTNSLDEVLTRSCKFFDEQVESSLSSITAKIQPIMLILMGAVVGSLFIAVYAPILTIMTDLKV